MDRRGREEGERLKKSTGIRKLYPRRKKGAGCCCEVNGCAADRLYRCSCSSMYSTRPHDFSEVMSKIQY